MCIFVNIFSDQANCNIPYKKVDLPSLAIYPAGIQTGSNWQPGVIQQDPRMTNTEEGFPQRAVINMSALGKNIRSLIGVNRLKLNDKLCS